MTARPHRPPKAIGPPTPFAHHYRDVLPEPYREALRRAAVVYLDECYHALRESGPDDPFAEMDVADHLPSRYAHYYDGLFAKEWTTTVAVVGWKLAQRAPLSLACVAEELALNALVREAIVQLELHDETSDQAPWDDFREVAFADEDFRYLFDPAFDGIENDAEATQRLTFVGLAFPEWFMPFEPSRSGHPHPFCAE